MKLIKVYFLVLAVVASFFGMNETNYDPFKDFDTNRCWGTVDEEAYELYGTIWSYDRAYHLFEDEIVLEDGEFHGLVASRGYVDGDWSNTTYYRIYDGFEECKNPELAMQYVYENIELDDFIVYKDFIVYDQY